MKKLFLILAIFLSLPFIGASAQLGGTEPYEIYETEDIPSLGHCDEAFCAEREPECGTWRGVGWCALNATNRGGDIVPVVDVQFSDSAQHAGRRLILRVGRDEAIFPDGFMPKWIFSPRHDQTNRPIRVFGRDMDWCRPDDRNIYSYYTQAWIKDGTDTSVKIESPQNNQFRDDVFCYVK